MLSYFFPIPCKIIFLFRQDLQTFDVHGFAYFLARMALDPICNRAQGLKVTFKYMYK